MKKIILIACGFLTLSVSTTLAQINLQQKELLTLGGTPNKSIISIQQILEQPMLIINDRDLHINTFEIRLISDDGKKMLGPFISQNAKFSPEMVAAVEEFRNFRGILKIEHIMLINKGKLLQEEALQFSIDK
jgi:hypothetical protein